MPSSRQDCKTAWGDDCVNLVGGKKRDFLAGEPHRVNSTVLPRPHSTELGKQTGVWESLGAQREWRARNKINFSLRRLGGLTMGRGRKCALCSCCAKDVTIWRHQRSQTSAWERIYIYLEVLIQKSPSQVCYFVRICALESQESAANTLTSRLTLLPKHGKSRLVN